MTRLTTKARKSLPKADFALPASAGSGKPGKGSFPIPDASHARNALARVASKPPAMQAVVKAKVAKKFPGIAQGGKKPSQPKGPRMVVPKGGDHAPNHREPQTHDEFMNMGTQGMDE